MILGRKALKRQELKYTVVKEMDWDATILVKSQNKNTEHKNWEW